MSRDRNQSNSREPTVREVKDVLRSQLTFRSTAKGVIIATIASCVYLCVFLSSLLAESIVLKGLCSLIAGGVIATLFVAGHDACHGALTTQPWLNRLLGRILFLPAFHPYAAWEHSHNGLHHAYTNIRDLDPVFPPLGPSEYSSLARAARTWERVMRSPAGVVLLYVWKVWLPFEVCPGRRARLKGSAARWFQFDRACCVAFLALQGTTALTIAAYTGQSAATLVVFSIALPAFVFFYLLAWAVHIHHTHPSVPWYASKSEWSFFRGQVRSSVHMKLPRLFELFILNIMDHTAHHADPKIPLYELHDAQRRIEAAYPHDIVGEAFTIRNWLRIFRVCRLYDYENHRWLDWDGTPLTAPLLKSRRRTMSEHLGCTARSTEPDQR